MRIVLLSLTLLLMGGLAFLASNATANMPSYAPTNLPRTIVIGVDLSHSNPLITDRAFAYRVAERINPVLAGLAPHSRIIFRSFGAYNSAANSPLTLDITIAPKTARAADMASLVSNVIAGIPQMVSQGRLQPQDKTNIIPFLINMSKVVDCRAMPTHVILASDGIEDSQVANLQGRNSMLPAPTSAPFSGCEDLQILGIGRGLNSPSDTERLRGEWHYWSQAAGFKGFIGLNDW